MSTVKELGESGVIKRIARIVQSSPTVIESIGDVADCTLLPRGKGKDEGRRTKDERRRMKGELRRTQTSAMRRNAPLAHGSMQFRRVIAVGGMRFEI